MLVETLFSLFTIHVCGNEGPMSRFPNNKYFAFAIHDDTDLSTVESIRPIYKLLEEIGMCTTKSVWPLASVPEGRCGGSSLQDPEYLRFILELRDKGFEIALHGVRNHDADRDLIEKGFQEFHRLIGYKPRIHVNHSRNFENIYWGEARFNTLRRLYRIAAGFGKGRTFKGHAPDSPYFWGDLCRDRIDYVRNFVFRETNLDRVNPTMPYRDPLRPFVKYWFSSCYGPDATSFCQTISEANQDQLEAEAGVCIMYTHFACDFVKAGKIEPRVEQLLRQLAKRQGWFAPVSTLLDFLRTERGGATITPAEFSSMERRWAWDQCGLLARRAVHHHVPADRRLRPTAQIESY
jgi:hypothetical protein